MIEHVDHCISCPHWKQADEACELSYFDPEDFFKNCPMFADTIGEEIVAASKEKSPHGGEFDGAARSGSVQVSPHAVGYVLPSDGIQIVDEARQYFGDKPHKIRDFVPGREDPLSPHGGEQNDVALPISEPTTAKEASDDHRS